jgi:ribokinase
LSVTVGGEPVSNESVGRVVVVGTVNVDDVFECPSLPLPGETVLALSTTRHQGGKGANQAAAAARWGAPTSLVALVGDDEDGTTALADLAAWGVDTTEVAAVDLPTGRALILLDPTGENSIVVASGANAALDADRATAALTRLDLTPLDVVLTNGEVAAEVVAAAARAAAQSGALHVHNLAPARDEDLGATSASLLVLNEVEVAQATGEADTETGVRQLLTGRPGVVITLGPRGAVAATPHSDVTVPAEPSQVVDTTGAGDAFCGALAAELVGGSELGAAVGLAVRAGSYAVTGAGARGALARREDVRS